MSEPIDIDYASITLLDLSNKQLDVLPDLSMYTNLKKIICSNNHITSLDDLPSGLKVLYCTDNQITSLNNLPASLEVLSCSYNKLTLLDNLPHSLVELYCYGNPFIYDFNPTLENIRNYNATRKA